jgi:hypothetical protein
MGDKAPVLHLTNYFTLKVFQAVLYNILPRERDVSPDADGE